MDDVNRNERYQYYRGFKSFLIFIYIIVSIVSMVLMLATYHDRVTENLILEQKLKNCSIKLFYALHPWD